MGDEKNAIDYAYRVSGYNRARVLSGLYGLHGENEREEADGDPVYIHRSIPDTAAHHGAQRGGRHQSTCQR